MNYPFVVSVPHCSNRIPDDIKRRLALSDEEICESTDVGTAEIFGSLPAAKVLCADWSRIAADLNRSPGQRDQKGVVAQVDYSGRLIYRPGSVPDEEEIERRLRAYYRPYHHQLIEALEHPEMRGLFDCHSLNGIGPPEAPDRGKKRKDITLSNNGDPKGCAHPRLGKTTCPAETLELIREAFEKSGFSVSINWPYSGGFITTHYGHELVNKGKTAVQIEINQDLYCKPNTLHIVPESLEDVRSRIDRSFAEIARSLL
jgi:N-formylglutamate deformylase